jgi:hypothetical protein
MKGIYRFVAFESFVDIVQRQALSFVSPSTWDDTYEGFIFRRIPAMSIKFLRTDP